MAKQKSKTTKTKAPKEVKKDTEELKFESGGNLGIGSPVATTELHVFSTPKPTQAEIQADKLLELHERTKQWLADGGKIQSEYQQARAGENAKIIRSTIKQVRSRRKVWR